MAPTTISIRVLIVEDSPVARELLVSILQSTPGLQVVGTARNGAEAVRLARRLRPDVITMDIHMPEMNGFEATRQIMSEAPCPIVMVSNGLDKYERELTFNALNAGALSVLNKPTMYDPPEVLRSLAVQVKLMSEVKVIRRWGDSAKPASTSQPGVEPPALKRNGKSKVQLVVIASSTGGPGVLAQILGQLPADFPAPILIVQHITPGFAAGLATWLNQQTSLEVRLARHADEPRAGQVLIAPDNYHMLVNRMGLIALEQSPPRHGLRPAADVLFNSVTQVYGATAIGVILTGMGSDGAEGLRALRESGAHTIAQDQASCVVFGMPAVAIELGAAEQVLPVQR
ncbi:MAG: chemotaxis response regulator protein-glutamate methylesterase, partial [Chloroflexota bacterium]